MDQIASLQTSKHDKESYRALHIVLRYLHLHNMLCYLTNCATIVLSIIDDVVGGENVSI